MNILPIIDVFPLYKIDNNNNHRYDIRRFFSPVKRIPLEKIHISQDSQTSRHTYQQADVISGPKREQE